MCVVPAVRKLRIPALSVTCEVPKTNAIVLPAILEGKLAESVLIHTSNESGQECRAWRSEVRYVVFPAAITISHKQTIANLQHVLRHSPLYILKLIYRSLLFVRTTVAVMEFLHTGVRAWQVPELDGVELDKIRQYTNAPILKTGSTEEAQANLSVPIYVGYLLRQTIARKEVTFASESEVDARLLAQVDSMLADYYSIQELLTLPPPLIYAETTCTFLYLYVFTLPMALVSLVDTGRLSDLATYVLAVFLSTYALLGLEMVSQIFDRNTCADAGFFRFR
jgi:Bestrophin, RFP-TM, chloride channel